MKLVLWSAIEIPLTEVVARAESRVFEGNGVRQPVIERQERRVVIVVPKPIRGLDDYPIPPRGDQFPSPPHGSTTFLVRHVFEHCIKYDHVEVIARNAGVDVGGI